MQEPGITWYTWNNENVWRVPQAFREFTGFCKNLGVARIFMNGNQAEADRLRSWFKLADSTFDLPLYASANWRYITPKWREQSFMQPFVREVREKFHHHLHMLRDPITKRQVCQNRHCAAVECLYYATHYQFKVDAQAFDLVREPPRYLHISRADKDWLVNQHPRIEPFHAAVVPKEPTPEAS